MLKPDRFSCSQKIWLKQDPPVHLVPFMYKIQEISKSNLIQIAGVYILSGSAEIISDWILR